ncbi:MAG TPA: DNA/RNA non-specific endonuclease [Chloroflexia bacterium]|nr:DNA/RNA non-specific endonuclease [Chloroflexia bacterium]
MEKKQIESILDDRLLVQELSGRLDAGKGTYKANQWSVPAGAVRRALLGAEDGGAGAASLTEAIIVEFGRPSLLVQHDTFTLPESDVWKQRLYPAKSRIEAGIRGVGRLELLDHDTYPWVGTAWMITEDIAVTNRHVALVFAQKAGKGFAFIHNSAGKLVRAQVDFKEEYREPLSLERAVKSVVFIEELNDKYPDLAFIRLDKSVGLPSPINLSTAALSSALDPDRYVGVIGYPARDSRNDATAMLNVFGDIYDVKRLAPGKVTSVPDGSFLFTHDCSTLGGNSGSVVIDVDTGEALGLHFGGQPRVANYAVSASAILQALRGLKIQVPVPEMPAPSRAGIAATAKALKPADYANRRGYLADFLGTGKQHEVPLPVLTDEQSAEVARLKEAGPGHGHTQEYVLNYTHFSLAVSAQRRLPFYTASNIDGARLRRMPRDADRWYLDPRIDAEAQAGGAIYTGNDLDKGHMVRRLDPVWGTQAEALLGDEDTFHYTNACPQHKDLNRKTWSDLEDYVLGGAGAHRLRVSVFTGPILGSTDPPYRGIKIPQEFWKLVVMVRTSDMKLSATAYLLTQKDMISDLREFVFGQFRTYQIAVQDVENRTGLSFGNLHDYDPMTRRSLAATGTTARLVEGPGDILL